MDQTNIFAEKSVRDASIEEFKECYNIKGGADTVIPVDIYVPGCAARPESIIDGVVKGVALFKEKAASLKAE